MDATNSFSLGWSFLYLNYFTVIIALFIALKTNKLNSTLLALGILIIIDSIMNYYTPALYSAAVLYQEEYSHHFRLVWYLGFAFMDLIAIFLVLYTHKFFKLELFYCAYAVIISSSLRMQLQIATYLDREFFNFENLKVIYSEGIPFINMTLSSIVFGIMIVYIASLLFNKFGSKALAEKLKIKGITWSI
jgi:hypothetical protein